MDLVANKSVLAVQNQQFAALVRVAMHHGSLAGRDLLHQFESELHFEVQVGFRSSSRMNVRGMLRERGHIGSTEPR